MIKTRAILLRLDAPKSFWYTDEATINMIAGGCGPGRFGNYGLFDSVYWLSIKAACKIHDFDYAIGKTAEDKKIADHRFLDNMLKIINTQSKSSVLRILRRYRAVSYYNLVVECGEDAFKEATLI